VAWTDLEEQQDTGWAALSVAAVRQAVVPPAAVAQPPAVAAPVAAAAPAAPAAPAPVVAPSPDAARPARVASREPPSPAPRSPFADVEP
jgi:2-oxoglutarate dehydrogenase E2 component (dihydrolipoamide succinyltransferase)